MAMDKFGYSLLDGKTYKIRGHLTENSIGENVWEFNSLLARRLGEKQERHEHQGVTIAGIGTILRHLELYDEDAGSVVQERLTLRHQLLVSDAPTL
jgi:hypothetical protein